MKPVTFLNTALCKTADNYSLHGVKKKNSEVPLFHNNSVNDEEMNTLFVATASPARISEETAHTQIHAPDTDIQEQQPIRATPDNKELFAKCMGHVCTVGMLLEALIASLETVKNLDEPPEVSQGLLVVVLFNTICMAYSQYKLIIDGFLEARTGQSRNNRQALSLKHQLQAFAGILCTIETGVKWHARTTTVVKLPGCYQQFLAGVIASGVAGSFLMANGHAICDHVPLSNTLAGKFVYGLLTSPLMPNFIQYMSSVIPIAGSVILPSAIITVKDLIKVENSAVTILFYALAFFSGISEFLLQKNYFCEVIQESAEQNTVSIESWNKFWYGDDEDRSALQMFAHAIKRFVDILSTIPLGALDASEKFVSACCYFTLAVLPIQIIALSQYIAQPAITYCVFYKMLHDASELIKTYTKQEINPLNENTQLIAATAFIPFGLAFAFTTLNLSGERILNGTNKVFSNPSSTVAEISEGDLSETLTDAVPEQMVKDQSTLIDETLTWRQRVSGVVQYVKSAATDVVSNSTKMITGRK